MATFKNIVRIIVFSAGCVVIKKCMQLTLPRVSCFKCSYPDSTVGIAWVIRWSIGVWCPAGVRDFSLLHRNRTDSGVHQTSYPTDTGSISQREKCHIVKLTTEIPIVQTCKLGNVSESSNMFSCMKLDWSRTHIKLTSSNFLNVIC
jgi:hypothetical protein